MKKIFTTVAAFCLGLFASITIVACADEFADNGGNSDSELQELKATVALLSARVAELEKGDCVTYFRDQSPDGDWGEATFYYDAKGRITSVHQRNSYGESYTENVSYTETGCTIGGKTIKGTTQRALNNAIIVWFNN